MPDAIPAARSRIRIDYIEIPAPDLPKAMRFYREVFGWGLREYSDSFCLFDDGSLKGGFVPGLKPTDDGPLLVFHVDEINDLLSRVREHGGTVIQEKRLESWGGYRAIFRDPNGNRLGAWQSVKTG